MILADFTWYGDGFPEYSMAVEFTSILSLWRYCMKRYDYDILPELLRGERTINIDDVVITIWNWDGEIS